MQGTAFSLKSFLDSLPQESPVDDYFFDFWIYLHAQRTLYMDHIAPEVLAMKEAAPDILSISCSLCPDVIGFQGHVISNLDLSVEWRT